MATLSKLSGEAASPCSTSQHTNLYLRVFQEFDCGCIIIAQPQGLWSSQRYSAQATSRSATTSSSPDLTERPKEQYPWNHELQGPIIDNPDDQTKLFDKLEDAFSKNPETNAVIVKGNGLVVSVANVAEAKLMFETLLQL